MKKVRNYFWVICLCLSVFTPTLAQTLGATDSSEQTLSISDKIKAQEKALTQLVQLLTPPKDTQGVTELVEKLPVNAATIEAKLADLDTTNVVAKDITQIEHLSGELSNRQAAIAAYQEHLQQGLETLHKSSEAVEGLVQLLSNPVNQAQVSDQQRQRIPQMQQQASELQGQFEKIILQQNEKDKLITDSVALLSRYKAALSTRLDTQQKSQSQTTLADESSSLSKQRQKYENQVATLQSRLSSQRDVLSLSEIETLQQEIYHNQTMAWLINIDVELLQAIKQTEKNTSLIQESAPVLQLEEQLAWVENTTAELDRLKDSVTQRFTQFSDYTDIIGHQPALDEAFTQRLKAIAYQRLHLKSKPKILSQLIADKKQKALFTRDALYRDNQWLSGVAGIKDALVLIAYQVKISFQTLHHRVTQNAWHIIALAVIGLLAVLFGVRSAGRLVSRRSLKKGMEAGIVATLRKLFYVLRKNAYLLVGMGFVVALVRVSDVPSPSDDIIRTLIYTVGVWLIWIELMRVEVRLGTLSAKKARRSHVTTTLLAVCTMLYALSYLSSAPAGVIALYEKALMLSIILFAWVFHSIVGDYLKEEKEHLNSKIYRFYTWGAAIIPKAFIGVCGLSLIGYGQLAWLILSYMGMGTLYGLMLVFGVLLINVLRKKAKLYSLRKFKHGAFIAQDIVSPVSTIIKLLWLWVCTAVLFILLGWDTNSYLIAKLLSGLNATLFQFGSNPISLMSIILLVLSVYLIFRVAKWLRTFSYHWLFAKINDLGVRHSLSIFSQYVATLIGVLVTLKIIGIDLTSLAVFAGALGVGIGLGLQDIAKNFISGILLLIERPLRSGDWVSIDGSEGNVKSIGMRAITIETFDKQEVIIPNGNAINNSFTNWTHSNSITRTVMYIGADYDSEPETVMAILQQIIENEEAILTDPAPMIVMWEYADSSINYRVQYFIDINNHSLLRTKTAILKAVWHEFKQRGVEIPFPQQDIHFRNQLPINADFARLAVQEENEGSQGSQHQQSEQGHAKQQRGRLSERLSYRETATLSDDNDDDGDDEAS